MTRTRLPGLAVLLVTVAHNTPVAAQIRLVETGRLAQWAAAVDQHQPGKDDEQVREVRSWPFADVQHIVRNVLPGIVSGMLERKVPNTFRVDLNPLGSVSGAPLSYRFPPTETELVRRVIEQALTDGDANHFLKRAALLHTDIAILNAGDAPADGGSGSTFTMRFADGEQTASGRGHSHWQTARGILRLVHREDAAKRKEIVLNPRGDADVRAWYTATLAHMASGDVINLQHLTEALALFDDSSEVVAFAANARARLATPALQRVVQGTQLTRGNVPAVASSREELRRAEELFRRSVQINPRNAEARLRRGRVLTLVDRLPEALRELRTALPDLSEPVLQYYGHMFLGDAAENSGDLALALSSYNRARDLYPTAQSARLALSHLALRNSGRDGAVKELEAPAHVASGGAPSPDDRTDPWWHFHESAGRHAHTLLDHWYAAVLAGGQR